MADSRKVPALLSDLWRDFNFRPNTEQVAAILHVDGPLFLPAGPGSGKTRVLLWRTVNLLTEHAVRPEEIFLSTFTEKAAFQLKSGLQTLLGAVSDKTGTPYDLARLYVGTVHSLCRRLILDRRIAIQRERSRMPVLLDELRQFMFLRQQRNWDAIIEATGLESPDRVLQVFNDRGESRLRAIPHLVSFFNRLSEEMVDPVEARKRVRDADLKALLKGYEAYRELLAEGAAVAYTDLSLLQSCAVERLVANPLSARVFRHVIVDEYQDTNPVQERLFFTLANGHKNICVVGDDDQALYRFRGATVENFVDFPERCETYLGQLPARITLATNYRSQEGIVGFFNRFITHSSCDWTKRPKGAYRVLDKKITAKRQGSSTAVVASSPGEPDAVAGEIAALVRKLLDAKKVADPSQIAFLFPSLKSPHVARMKAAIEDVGLAVYAPRAGQFLDVDESQDVFGVLFQILGTTSHLHSEFKEWLDSVLARGETLLSSDPFLARFVEQRVGEIAMAKTDFCALTQRLEKMGLSSDDPFDADQMAMKLGSATGLSARAQKALTSPAFVRFARQRAESGRPLNIQYVMNRVTSLEWSLLDIFYQLAGFQHFKQMFDLAESGKDEGPVCNLSLISQYLARFLEHYPFPLSGESLYSGQALQNLSSFLYVLFRRGETEYEDANDPFPKGRIPFITIHQSKGLEFPVVVLANPRKDGKLQRIEEMVAPILTRKGEPLDRLPAFDVMRMFYVALSRAKNLLVLAHFRGRGQRLHPAFDGLLDTGFPRIPSLNVAKLPTAEFEEPDVPRSYSYTGDYLLYLKCPRQYMLFKKYDFAPARSQTMFFGNLVHQTLEDLHQRLISAKEGAS